MLVTDRIIIAEKIYKIRKNKGMTREEVAEKAEISDRTYADIERGTVNMRMETLLRICAALNITPDDIFTEKERSVTVGDITDRLVGCTEKELETVLKLLTVYLDSL